MSDNKVAEQGESGWRPIETAPRDETEILVFGPYGWYPSNADECERFGCVVAVHVVDNEWSSITANPYTDCIFPTHWMPLPDAPK